MSQIIFSIVSGLVVFIAIEIIKRFVPSLYSKLGKFIPLISTGVLILAQVCFNLVTANVDDTVLQRIGPFRALWLGTQTSFYEIGLYNVAFKLVLTGIEKVKGMITTLKLTTKKEGQ